MYYNFCKPLRTAPHILIAGQTGSGKSVLLNDILFSFMQMGGAVSFILIDPKIVELAPWKNCEYCEKYVTDNVEIIATLENVLSAIETRYEIMSHRGLLKWTESDTYIVIDEIADLMVSMKNRFLPLIQRIAQIGRAAGYHLICATQSPSRITIPAVLTLNFTHKIALRCDSAIESRQILGREGAEELPQYGKALLKSPDGFFTFDVPMTAESDKRAFIDAHYQHYEEPKTAEPKRMGFFRTLWEIAKVWATV